MSTTRRASAWAAAVLAVACLAGCEDEEPRSVAPLAALPSETRAATPSPARKATTAPTRAPAPSPTAARAPSPSPRPTPRPATAAPVPRPVVSTRRPAPSALTCSASMSDANPEQYSSTTVVVRTAASAGVSATAHYKTTDTTNTGTADSSGLGLVDFRISRATAGYRVVVDVVVSKAGRTASCSTSFVPR